MQVKKLTSTAFLLLQIPVEVFYLQQFAIFISMFLSSPISENRYASRIVSLVPSQTELLYYMGLTDEVVGITKFCIHPAEWYRNKIRVGGTKEIDIEKIISLEADLVIANKEENVREQIGALQHKMAVWLTDVNNLDEALQMIKDLGKLVNRNKEASELVINITAAFSKNQAYAFPPVLSCYLIWKDPFMTVGHDTFIHDMMQHAGYANAFADATRYPIVTIDDILQSGCKVLLLSSEPYPFKEKHIAELAALLPGIKILLVDGEMFSWYGSRLLLAPVYFKALRQKFS